jgi:hypothetical protein
MNLGKLNMLNRIRKFDINNPRNLVFEMPPQEPPPIDLFEKNHFEEVGNLIAEDKLFSPQFESIIFTQTQFQFLPKTTKSQFIIFSNTDNVCISTLPDGNLIDIEVRFKNCDIISSDFYWNKYTGEICINLKDGTLDKNTINITAKIKYLQTYILLTYFY